jgi:hypothetical protein
MSVISGATVLKIATHDVVLQEAADATEIWIITIAGERCTLGADHHVTMDTSVVVAETTRTRAPLRGRVPHPTHLAPIADSTAKLAEAEAKTECEVTFALRDWRAAWRQSHSYLDQQQATIVDLATQSDNSVSEQP